MVRAIVAESIYRCMLLFLDRILYRRAHFVRDALCRVASCARYKAIPKLFKLTRYIFFNTQLLFGSHILFIQVILSDCINFLMSAIFIPPASYFVSNSFVSFSQLCCPKKCIHHFFNVVYYVLFRLTYLHYCSSFDMPKHKPIVHLCLRCMRHIVYGQNITFMF